MRPSVKRPVSIGAVLFLFIAGGLAIYAWRHYSPAGATYPASSVAHVMLPHRLRDGPEHDAARTRNGGEPYVLRLAREESGALLYFGAAHSRDADHPQLGDITSRWDEFAPTVALYEGRARGFFYGALIEPFAGLPEPALVHKLARRDNVPLYTLEPAYRDEVGQLLSQFAAKQVALYFFLRVYSSETGGTANETRAQDLLTKRTNVDGLRGSLSTLPELDRLWQTDFSTQEDWRVIQREPGYLADISDVSRQIRGMHMVRVVIDLVNRGERVFAVVGSGHVIRQEWNLRAALGQAPAWDQPPGRATPVGVSPTLANRVLIDGIR